MTFLDRLSAKRQWTEEERLVLDQVTRVADGYSTGRQAVASPETIPKTAWRPSTNLA